MNEQLTSVKERRSNIKDLSGMVFGRLTVLEITDSRSKGGSVIWLCKCSCGNESKASQNDLVRGNVVSCGCRKRENNRNIYQHLRLVDGTCIEFLEKRKSRSDNKTGHAGVTQYYNGKYRANIGFKGKRYHLGTFKTIEEAIEARKRAEMELHGDFLRNYYKSFAKDVLRQMPEKEREQLCV